VKKLYFILQWSAFLAFNFFLLLTVYQLAMKDTSTTKIGYQAPVYDQQEEYDPSLLRLNSMKKLELYCDSLFAEKSYRDTKLKFEEEYPSLVSAAISKRFYHGYSVYGFNDNFVATLFSSMISVQGLSAIVIPEDIIKFPYAACSQQSILVMDILRKKGFKTRKVGFQGKKYGHFCFEVFYQGSWHFFDPDMEPDAAVLAAYNRPGIEFLARNPGVLETAYRKYTKDMVLDIFPNYHLGIANAALAPKASLFHRVTGFLSYTMWFFFLMLFVWARRKLKNARAAVGKQPAKIAVMDNVAYPSRFAL